jgi:hypothetical protein
MRSLIKLSLQVIKKIINVKVIIFLRGDTLSRKVFDGKLVNKLVSLTKAIVV